MGERRSLWRPIWTVVSVSTTVIGFVGIPDNIAAWGKLFAMISSEVLRWSLLGLCVVFVTVINYVPVRDWLRQRRAAPPSEPPRVIPCPQCRTTARLWGRWEKPCPKCKALGYLPGAFLQYLECAYCDGSGKDAGRWERDCPVCHGYGRHLPAEVRQAWEEA